MAEVHDDGPLVLDEVVVHVRQRHRLAVARRAPQDELVRAPGPVAAAERVKDLHHRLSAGDRQRSEEGGEYRTGADGTSLLISGNAKGSL